MKLNDGSKSKAGLSTIEKYICNSVDIRLYREDIRNVLDIKKLGVISGGNLL